ncbi:MAG: C1 family peptidase [Nereida ignava]
MTDSTVTHLEAGGVKRRLSVLEDFPDLRDRIYAPSLLKLQHELEPDYSNLIIRNQFEDGACVGFALSAAINLLQHDSILGDAGVSPRMLFEMAKLHDEWPGNHQNGSSLRGGLKGFFHNGVCSETIGPFDPEEHPGWSLSLQQAEDAKNTGLGAYYRLRPNIIDYHSALNEVGVIIVSAMIHKGWKSPRGGVITHNRTEQGGHAFAIIGYDAEGFIIQNSWGDKWGKYKGNPGIAHWSYEDWASNIIDAWVLRLAAPTPKAFGVVSVVGAKTNANGAATISAAPRSQEIQHHYIHLDDGKFVSTGRYSSDMGTVREMAKNIRNLSSDAQTPVKHVMIYAHGGLNSSQASARRIRAMRSGFLRNGVYPVHLMWETGFTEELFDVLASLGQRSSERVGASLHVFDRMIEKFSHGMGRRLWREMKTGARRSFEPDGDGRAALTYLMDDLQDLNLQFHFIGHSAGSLLLGEMIDASSAIFPKGMTPSTFTLMAPACSTVFYKEVYAPALHDGRLPSLNQYLLNDTDERADNAGPYGKSLLYLVSRALDTAQLGTREPLMGLERDIDALGELKNHALLISGKRGVLSNCETHGGYDNDPRTMNTVLRSIVGRKLTDSQEFKDHELSTI